MHKNSHASMRNMSCCAVIGQAAGIGAAISLKSNRSVDAADIGAVQKELARQGVRYS